MNCLSENLIQAYIDGETKPEQARQIMLHLEQCKACKHQFNEMKIQSEFLTERLTEYNLGIHRASGKQAAMSQLAKGSDLGVNTGFTSIEKSHSNKGAKRPMKTYQKWIATAAAVGIIVVGMGSEPVKAAVSDAVSIFRAERIETVDISLASLQQLEQSISAKEGEIHIDNLADIVQSGGETKVVSADEAKGLVNFKITPPQGLSQLTPQNVEVTSAQKIDITLKIEPVNELMKTLGATTLFDQALDGKTFTVSSSAVGSFEYAMESGSYLHFSQTRLPEVIAPAGVATKDLVDAVASMGILPTDLQARLKSLSDVNNTLYLPNVDGKLETKNIGGLTVYSSFEKSGDSSYGYATWLSDGVLSVLSGQMEEKDLEKIILGE